MKGGSLKDLGKRIGDLGLTIEIRHRLRTLDRRRRRRAVLKGLIEAPSRNMDMLVGDRRQAISRSAGRGPRKSPA